MAARHSPRSANIHEFLVFHINATQSTAANMGAPYDLGHGVYLMAAVINDPGTGTWTLTLYNGNPSAGGLAFATIKATTNVTLRYRCVLDQGLYYTYSGGTTAGSTTLRVLPVPV